MLIKVHLLSLNCLENISLGLEIELGFALFYSRNRSKPIMAAVAGRISGAHDVNKAACFFQAIGNALCATGFGESIAGVISDVHHPIAERAIAAIVIILLTLVNLVSE